MVLRVNFPYFLSNIFSSGIKFCYFCAKVHKRDTSFHFCKKLSKFYVDEKVHQKMQRKVDSLRENQGEKWIAEKWVANKLALFGYFN